MSILIVVMIFVFILGSMLWVLPSPKERKQMKLRREAMRRGLQVQLSKLDDPLNPLQKISCVAYRLPYQAARNKARSWLIYHPDITARRDIEGWGFAARCAKPDVNSHGNLAPLLSELPKYSLALELTPVSVGLYWRERGESEDVDRIYKVLTDLQSF